MNTYLVVWTYVANFGKLEIQATSAVEAAEKVRNFFSEDFRKRGTCYVALTSDVTIFLGDKH